MFMKQDRRILTILINGTIEQTFAALRPRKKPSADNGADVPLSQKEDKNLFSTNGVQEIRMDPQSHSLQNRRAEPTLQFRIAPSQ